MFRQLQAIAAHDYGLAFSDRARAREKYLEEWVDAFVWLDNE